MLKQAPLVEGCQSVYSSLEQAQLLHVVVHVELFLNFLSALCENFSKLRNPAQDCSQNGLKNQDEPITGALRHIDSLLGDIASLCKKNFRIFALHGSD